MRLSLDFIPESPSFRSSGNGPACNVRKGSTIPPSIRFPDWVNRDFVRWRWENYNGM